MKIFANRNQEIEYCSSKDNNWVFAISKSSRSVRSDKNQIQFYYNLNFTGKGYLRIPVLARLLNYYHLQ